jgi:hypothetical protein
VESPAFKEIAWTAQTFGQRPSSLLEIRDWSIACELDVEAALYLHNEEVKREMEKEQRDREFWMAMFGGKSPEIAETDGPTLEESMTRSALGSR